MSSVSSSVQGVYNIGIPEMFQSIVINKAGFGMDAYKLPSTVHEDSRKYVFPKSVRRDIQYEAAKRAGEPSPSKYTLTDAMNFKRNWDKANGKFLNGKKVTLIDEVMKRNKNSPGPSEYFKNAQMINGSKLKNMPLGKFE